MNFDPSRPILGLDLVPSWSEKAGAAGMFFQHPAAGAAIFCLTDAPGGDLDTSTRRVLQQAHFAIENKSEFSARKLEELHALVGPVNLLVVAERGAIVQVHKNVTSVFAQMAIEMLLEVGEQHQIRHCEVCGSALRGHGNAKTCGPDCRKKRKQHTDRQRYQRLTAN